MSLLDKRKKVKTIVGECNYCGLETSLTKRSKCNKVDSIGITCSKCLFSLLENEYLNKSRMKRGVI